jgi:hypothetical protein
LVVGRSTAAGIDRVASDPRRQLSATLESEAIATLENESTPADMPNPMAGMSPPHVPEQPVPVLRNEQLGALLHNSLRSADGSHPVPSLGFGCGGSTQSDTPSPSLRTRTVEAS